MKHNPIIRFLTGRQFMTILLIAMQIAWITVLYMKVISFSDWISTILEILSFVIALHVIKRNDVPAYRMGWLVLVLVLPIFGVVMYLLLAEKRPSQRMRAKLAKGEKNREEYIYQDEKVIENLKKQSPRVAGSSRYLANYAGYPIWENTLVKYHSLGEYQWQDMLIELKKAKHFIFMEYFIIQEGKMWNSILDVLSEKVNEGVDVRFIYDDFGSVSKISSDYYQKLEKIGIKCEVFNRFIPMVSLVMNNRDHRKITVIDGHTAFTGGINLADEYSNLKVRFGHWKDTGVMIKGDAVWNFTVMFLQMWNSFRKEDDDYTKFKYMQSENTECFSNETNVSLNDEEKLEHVNAITKSERDKTKLREGGFVQPFTDSPLDYETVSANVYHDILEQAKDYVYIFSPYLAISDELQQALCNAVKRGVDVRIVTPGIPDKPIAYRLTRTYYEALLEAGVRIYEYTPGFIHAKSYVCDDELAVVGTINMDYRSLYLHFECGVFMYKNGAIDDLKQDALDTFEVSHEVKKHEFKRTAIGSLFDALLRVLAPLF